jgi:hypothetical protein
MASTKELAAMIRRSRVLDPVAKRQWLRVLPHLTPPDRARLEGILALERSGSAPPAGPPPDPPR